MFCLVWVEVGSVRFSKYSWRNELKSNLSSRQGKREYIPAYTKVHTEHFTQVPKIVYYYLCIRYKEESEIEEIDKCQILRNLEFLLRQ